MWAIWASQQHPRWVATAKQIVTRARNPVTRNAEFFDEMVPGILEQTRDHTASNIPLKRDGQPINRLNLSVHSVTALARIVEPGPRQPGPQLNGTLCGLSAGM